MARPKKRPPDPLAGKLPPPEPIRIEEKKDPNEVNLDSLLNQAMNLVRSELVCIEMASEIGKLEPEFSRDLVAYTKLIYDLKNDSSDALLDYSDEELAHLAK